MYRPRRGPGRRSFSRAVAGRRRRRRRPSRGPCRTCRRAAARRRPRSSCRRRPARSRGSPPSRSSTTAVITPRWIQSIRYGAQPVLMTCPPRATATVLPVAVGTDEVVADAGGVRSRASCSGQGVEPVADRRGRARPGGRGRRRRPCSAAMRGRRCAGRSGRRVASVQSRRIGFQPVRTGWKLVARVGSDPSQRRVELVLPVAERQPDPHRPQRPAAEVARSAASPSPSASSRSPRPAGASSAQRAGRPRPPACRRGGRGKSGSPPPSPRALRASAGTRPGCRSRRTPPTVRPAAPRPVPARSPPISSIGRCSVVATGMPGQRRSSQLRDRVHFVAGT